MGYLHDLVGDELFRSTNSHLFLPVGAQELTINVPELLWPAVMNNLASDGVFALEVDLFLSTSHEEVLNSIVRAMQADAVLSAAPSPQSIEVALTTIANTKPVAIFLLGYEDPGPLELNRRLLGAITRARQQKLKNKIHRVTLLHTTEPVATAYDFLDPKNVTQADWINIISTALKFEPPLDLIPESDHTQHVGALFRLHRTVGPVLCRLASAEFTDPKLFEADSPVYRNLAALDPTSGRLMLVLCRLDRDISGQQSIDETGAAVTENEVDIKLVANIDTILIQCRRLAAELKPMDADQRDPNNRPDLPLSLMDSHVLKEMLGGLVRAGLIVQDSAGMYRLNEGDRREVWRHVFEGGVGRVKLEAIWTRL
ncbi:hypothetical protein J8273_3715 [Carpediemonas membranifera]|uniref:Uncharacterized protein n=1 Tax=Carpediemonas membranifera TaxID=201153 RepID=A0A8J6B7I6_9EUKA|nr:hypothetical protein J8273_3715 [Carpediemonas membranifera]|eukprot:KAG9394739.1 hypothetical protein J8273_3715 [Carpediemonas membranifera]